MWNVWRQISMFKNWRGRKIRENKQQQPEFGIHDTTRCPWVYKVSTLWAFLGSFHLKMLLNDKVTEGQGKTSTAPLFSKRGYKNKQESVHEVIKYIKVLCRNLQSSVNRDCIKLYNAPKSFVCWLCFENVLPHDSASSIHQVKAKTLKERSSVCHSHKPQPTLDTKAWLNKILDFYVKPCMIKFIQQLQFSICLINQLWIRTTLYAVKHFIIRSNNAIRSNHF